jgi:uncharacterized coiled-coil protein SlyX
MSKDYLALERHYQIREKRLRDKIKYLETHIDDLNVTIKEQQVQISRLQSDNKYKTMLIDRLTTFGGAVDNSPHKESIITKIKNLFVKK